MSDLPDGDTPPRPPMWLRIENIVDRFEETWRQGRRPILDEYLLADAATIPKLRFELIHTELELRLEAGEPARVEDYLTRYPDLAGDAAAVRALLVAEFQLRRWREPNLHLDEYKRRFPAHAAELPLLTSGSLASFAAIGGAPPVQPGESRWQIVPSKRRELPRVPGYDILEEIGCGGMGVVYKALQVSLQRLIALKMIRDGRLADREQRQRFLTEAQALARLHHANVVAVYAVDEHDGLLFFAQEFLAGGTLADRLAKDALPIADAIALTATLARALHVAHAAGIVHRDLKPANVLLADDGTPKISDFGLACLLDAAERHTESNVILGTPAYMAPEQAAGKAKDIGAAADIYALGVILYEMLVGQVPFRGTSKMDVLRQVVNDEPTPPRRLLSKLPRDLETICLKCLNKEPGKRYTAAALAEDLERCRKGEPILARPAGPLERVVKWTRRRPALASLLGVSLAALLVLLSVGLFFMARLREERNLAFAQQRRAETALEESRKQRLRAEKNLRLAMGQLIDRQLKMGSPKFQRLPPAQALKQLRQELSVDAFRSFQILIDQAGDDPAARFEKASAYVYTGRLHGFQAHHAQAIAAYERAIALLESLAADFSTDVLYRQELAQTSLFLAHELHATAQAAPEDRKQWDQKGQQATLRALENYRAAIRMAPGDCRGLNYLAWVLATCEYGELRQPGEAVSHAEKLTSLVDRSGYWNTLGVAYYSNREYKKAIEALTKSLTLPSTSPQVYSWYYLAMSHGKLGDKKQARTWYEKAHDWAVKNRLKDETDDIYCLENEAKEVLGVGAGEPRP